MRGFMFNQTGILLQTMLYLVAKQDSKNSGTDANIPHPNNFTGTDSVTKCFGDYGCFNTEYPWTVVTRPISMLPESPEKLRPIFCLYTRRNEGCQELDITNPEMLYNSYLVPGHRLYFLAHGYMESGRKGWIYRMIEELLRREDANVIVVDWSSGSAPPYAQAVANIRLIGVMSAHLVHNIIKMGLKPEFVHVIGHSLGAHLSGYMGYTLQTKFNAKLGRISGLDPAEPHFSKTDPVVRLDPTDADYVDIIHTDATPFINGGLGINDPVGHVDFYPNGGVDQPGCDEGVNDFISKEKGSFFRGLHRFLGCNHIRSYEYFIESINTECMFAAAECSSWEEFKNGTCFRCGGVNSVSRSPPLCTKFGFHSDAFLAKSPEGNLLELPVRQHIKLYLMTSGNRPYCRHHYRVTLQISKSSQSVSHGGEVGMFWVTLRGDTGATQSLMLSDREHYFEPGSRHQVVVAGVNVGKLRSATLEWEYKTSILNPLTWRLLKTPRIHLGWVTVDSLETGESMVLCPEDGFAITSTVPLQLEAISSHESDCRQKYSNVISH